MESEFIKHRLIRADRKSDGNLYILVAETRNLIDKGYEPLLVESMIMNLLKSMMSGGNNLSGGITKGVFNSGMEVMKEKIGEMIAEMLGIEGKWKKAFGIALGNIDISDIPKLLTDCQFTSEFIIETVLEFASDYLNDSLKNEEDGFVVDMIRTVLIDSVRNTEVIKGLQKTMSEYICKKMKGVTDKFSNLLN